MRVRFFSIPAVADAQAAEELNRFLAGNRILSMERHLIPDGPRSLWAVCVTYDDGGPRAPSPSRVVVRSGEKPDFRTLLTEPEFAVFSRFRVLRKSLAERDGIPIYAVLSNDHLARIVRERMDTVSQLREIQGVGESRIEKYGEAFLAVIREAALPAPEPPADAA